MLLLKMADKKSDRETTRTSTSEKASDTVPEYVVFKNHYHGLTKLLFNTNLTPHLIQEGVIAPADHEKLSAINTSTEKAEVVLPKITSGLEAGLTESFYKMLEIMKCYGNRDAQQLSITIENEIAVSKSGEEPIPTKVIVMDELSLEFSAMVADVAEILDKSAANLNTLKSVCYNIATLEKSLLFSDKESAAIRASPSVFDVFYELRGHWRWDSHRLLFTLIKRSRSKEAMEKLIQFQKKINYTKKLIELTKYYQSVQKPPPLGYTRMIAIIEKDYSDFTVTECKELDEYLADFFGSMALCPFHPERSHSIKVTWYIPTEAVSGVLGKAYQAKGLLQLLSISYFEIDEVVIWNKKWLSLQVLTVQLSEKDSLITSYCSKISQVEVQLRQVTDEKDSLNEEVKTSKQKCANLQLALDKAEAEKLQMKPQAKVIKDDQPKGQKTESVHTMKMKCDELQVKLREKDIHVKHLKDQLNESEKKILQLQKELASIKTSELKESDHVKSLDSEDKSKQIDDLQKVKNENEILQKEKMQSQEDTTSELSTQVEELSKEVTQLKGINSFLRIECEDLKVRNTELQKKEKQPQSQEDTSKQHLKDSELSSQVEELDKEVMELKGINSLLRIENDDLKELQIKEQQSREALQAQIKSLQEQLKKPIQSQEETSKLHLKNSELSSQVEELDKEVMKLKGINSLLRIESDDLKEQISKLQKKEQQTNERLQAQIKSLQEQLKKPRQVITQVPETDSDSKAIIKELNDEVTSYIGLLDERDDIIRKLQTENKQLKEEKEQAKKHQVGSMQLKEEPVVMRQSRVDSKEDKGTKQWRRASMYVKLSAETSAESSAGMSSDLQKWLQKRRERTDKDDQ